MIQKHAIIYCVRQYRMQIKKMNINQSVNYLIGIVGAIGMSALTIAAAIIAFASVTAVATIITIVACANHRNMLWRFGRRWLSENIAQNRCVTQHAGFRWNFLALQWIHISAGFVDRAKGGGSSGILELCGRRNGRCKMVCSGSSSRRYRPLRWWRTIGRRWHRTAWKYAGIMWFVIVWRRWAAALRRRYIGRCGDNWRWLLIAMHFAIIRLCVREIVHVGRKMLALIHFELVFNIAHIEQSFDLQLLGDLHDARYLWLGNIHLTGVHILEQCLHFEWLHFGENDDTMLHGNVLQNRLEIWRIGGQHNTMCFKLHFVIHIDGAVDIALLMDERMQYFHQIRFVIVPAQAVGLSFATTHFECFAVYYFTIAMKSFRSDQ